MSDDTYVTAVSTAQFNKDMGKNPLGDDPILKVVENTEESFIAEYYADGIAGEKIQVWRPRYKSEEHFRDWVKVCDFDHCEGDKKKLFDTLAVEDILTVPNLYPNKD